MAELTRAQVFQVRAWVGDTPDQQEIQERFDDLGGTIHEVARQILQERLGSLSDGPAKFNAQGDYSADNTANIAILESKIADLSIIIEGVPVPGLDTTVCADAPSLVRDDRERLFL